ncbi:MAG: zinc ribbon domain-containing protein [Elusimicrobia bacterium]|nr:zinc ribbon domain-containing protein [Elusimicrobiota bacterium]
MDCPKCGAKNAPDSVFCGLCYETFRPKAAAPAPAPPPAAPAGSGGSGALPEVSVALLEWTLAGPLVVKPAGLYFFVKACVRPQAKEPGLGSRIIGKFGIVGAIAGAAFDLAHQAAQEHKRQALGQKDDDSARPHQVDFLPNALIGALHKEGLLAAAPGIVACKEYFELPRENVRSIVLGAFGGATIVFASLAGDETLTVTADPARLKALLAAAGWPV